ncbi:oxidoreductase C-terminal domain-containing protein [Streptomyces massasporeus]|uniref:Oxidoreductase C-terminal domain-containing protein n=1 Tax=Streptomyces massasporeus TaxID=67324 RepID=A0ABW6LEJ8_9ACTN
MAAARNLPAAPEARRPFPPVPSFWSDQYGTRIRAYGLLRGHDEAAVMEGDFAERRFLAAYRRGGPADRRAGDGRAAQGGARPAAGRRRRSGPAGCGGAAAG